jgi:N-acetylglutamate synthase-like GNAT family acetyltransferase
VKHWFQAFAFKRVNVYRYAKELAADLQSSERRARVGPITCTAVDKCEAAKLDP